MYTCTKTTAQKNISSTNAQVNIPCCWSVLNLTSLLSSNVCYSSTITFTITTAQKLISKSYNVTYLMAIVIYALSRLWLYSVLFFFLFRVSVFSVLYFLCQSGTSVFFCGSCLSVLDHLQV